MTTKLKITATGSTLGVILPHEAPYHRRDGIGDTLLLTEILARIKLSPHDKEVERQLESAEAVMCPNQNLCGKLAP